MVLEDHESCREHGGLQESGETDSNDLLAPLGKTVNISSWNRKHIKASNCDLYEQDASSFQVSEKHCGFVINRGNATAAEILQLMKDVQERVKKQSGVTLEPEVKMIGEF